MVELATSYAKVVLEHHQKTVFIKDLSDNGLVHVAPLERLLSRAFGEHVAHFSQKPLNDLGGRYIFLVTYGKRDFELVNKKRVQENWKISKRTIERH